MAREAKDQAKRLLAQGIDPSEKRKADKRAAAAMRAFGEVADERFDTKRAPEAKSEPTLKRDRWLKRESGGTTRRATVFEPIAFALAPALYFKGASMERKSNAVQA